MVKESDIGKQVYVTSCIIGLIKGVLLNNTNFLKYYFAVLVNNKMLCFREDEIFTSKRDCMRELIKSIPPQIEIDENKITSNPYLTCSEISSALKIKPVYLLNGIMAKYGIIISVKDIMQRTHMCSNHSDIIIKPIQCYRFYDLTYNMSTHIQVNDVKIFAKREDVIKEISRKIKEL